MDLTEVNQAYESIIHSNKTQRNKDLELAHLMRYMELHYDIPLTRNPDWEKENKTVIAMYRKVSKSRSI